MSTSTVSPFSTSSMTAPSPSLPDPASQASVVLAHAALYPETASRLSSLQTLQIPGAEQSANLVDLRPKIEILRNQQEDLQEQVRMLRERSARILQWWVEVGVVGMGGLWEDWVERIEDIDKTLKRWERQKAEEDGYI
jgi:hypothetical protein